MAKIDLGIELSLYPENFGNDYHYVVRDTETPGVIEMAYVEGKKQVSHFTMSAKEARQFAKLINKVADFMEETTQE